MSQLNLPPELLASLVNVITPFNEDQFIDKLYDDINFIMADLENILINIIVTMKIKSQI